MSEMLSSFYYQWKHIPESEIGDFGHVDHQNYIRWMREINHDHFADLGFTREYFVDKKECFVVRRHGVEHLSPCFLNDRLLLVTWVSELGNKVIKRQHRIYKIRESGELVPVVRAQNLSIYVDDQLRATSIPEEISRKFTVCSDAEVQALIKTLNPPQTLSLVGS